MKILAFGDLHGDDEALDSLRHQALEHNPDLIVCVGDFTIFGIDLFVILEQLNLIAEISNTKLILIHGNHEDEDAVSELLSDYEHIIYIHKDIFEFDGFTFVGYGGGGFSLRANDFVSFVSEHTLDFAHKKLILLTHQPPYGTKLDTIRGRQTGNADFTEFIKTHQPILALSGHIHETFGEVDEIGKTKLLNPGPHGVIIEL
jgi:uncharacterized protein